MIDDYHGRAVQHAVALASLTRFLAVLWAVPGEFLLVTCLTVPKSFRADARPVIS